MQPDEAIVYDVVTELLNKRQLSDDTFGKAKQILGEQQVVDLVAVTGFYVMVSAVVIARTNCDTERRSAADAGPGQVRRETTHART